MLSISRIASAIIFKKYMLHSFVTVIDSKIKTYLHQLDEAVLGCH